MRSRDAPGRKAPGKRASRESNSEQESGSTLNNLNLGHVEHCIILPLQVSLPVHIKRNNKTRNWIKVPTY